MILSHEHRFVFVKTRKTAGTSVEIALAEHTGPNDVLTSYALAEDNELRRERGADAQNQLVPLSKYGSDEWKDLFLRRKRAAYRSHMPATEVRRLVRPRVWDQYLTFTIVRNPWQVAASAYAWRARERVGRLASKHAQAGSGARSQTFREFLIDVERAWNNWPLYADGDGVMVDAVIRYERLDEDLEKIARTLGLPKLDLPRAKSGYRKTPYQELYGDEERQIVAEVCRREIDEFGFEF